MKNSLETECEYYSLVLRGYPNDEEVRFAYAAALREIGKIEEANCMYDAGIHHLDKRWFSKLFWFFGVGILMSCVIWGIGIHILWLIISTLVSVPLIWFLIRQNRHKWIPTIALTHRQENMQTIDLSERISNAKKTLNMN